MALSDNLLAYWKLDESSGNAADASGNGYTLTNTNSVAYASALINNGADFGTTDQHNKTLSATTIPTIPTGGAFAISLWVKPRTVPQISQERYILSYSKFYESGINLTYYGDGTKRYIGVYTQGATNRIEHTLSTTSFTNIIVTYPLSGSGKLYINGSYLAAITRLASLSGGTEMYLGWYGDSQAFSCYLDEIGAWGRELTAGEATSLYNAGAGITYPFPASGSSKFFQLF